jgi:flagellar biosynthetic protein FliQ
VNSDVAIELTIQAVMLGFKLTLPFLVASLIVGLVISVVQAATQVQEMTLTFVPKMIVTGVVLVIAGPWMLAQISAYTNDLFTAIPQLSGP